MAARSRGSRARSNACSVIGCSGQIPTELKLGSADAPVSTGLKLGSANETDLDQASSIQYATRQTAYSAATPGRGQGRSSMKVFVAGGTGAVGKRLVPLLVNRGHEVVATTRTAEKIPALRAMGAEAVVVDGVDRHAVEPAVGAAAPEPISHQMTALASMRSLKHFDREFASTNRLRDEGSQFLVAAAVAAGARRLGAQSYTGWPNPREGGRVKTEDDGLDPTPPRSMRDTLDAI